MTKMNRSTKPFAVVIALVAAAALWTAWPASHVLALQDSEDMPSPISIAFGQTLQLNVANASSGDSIPVEMMILDESGNPLKRSRELVMPLHTSMLTLNRNEVPGREASRLLTRAVVKVIGDPDIKIGDLLVSEEVVDNETQRTMLLHPGISRGFNPQPDPPGQIQ
jgi:hypothetical protein